MPEAGQYASHLSHEAVAFVVGLSKKRQRFVLDLADQIARQPFQIGHYRMVDGERQVGKRGPWNDDREGRHVLYGMDIEAEVDSNI